MDEKEARALLKSKGLKLDLIDSHIAFRLDKLVVLNKNLFHYDPNWVEKIVDHEIRHTGKLTKKDFAMDLFEGDMSKTLKFCFRHPKAFKQFNPFLVYKGIMTIDVINLVFYIFITIFLIIFGVMIF